MSGESTEISESSSSIDLFGPQRVLLGTSAKLAIAIGVSPALVRVGFFCLGLSGGIGVIGYLALTLVLWGRDLPTRPVTQRSNLGGVVFAVGLMVVVLAAFPALPTRLLLALTLVLLGLTISKLVSDQSDRTIRAGLVRVFAGLVLSVAGIATALDSAYSPSQIWGSAVAVVAMGAGAAVVVMPWIAGVIRSAESDRRQRIRSEERADIAAHIHDSVLQTLTLIQNRASEPRVTAALAHQQERELRRWLYGSEKPESGEVDSLKSALEYLGEEIEDQYLIVVETICVGDTPLTPGLEPLLAATREALVNAAKFSECQLLSLFCEVGDQEIEVFVRDRGIGFDPATVEADRHGISDSIHSRVHRIGGRSAVRSSIGDGTEVIIAVPL